MEGFFAGWNIDRMSRVELSYVGTLLHIDVDVNAPKPSCVQQVRDGLIQFEAGMVKDSGKGSGDGSGKDFGKDFGKGSGEGQGDDGDDEDGSGDGQGVKDKDEGESDGEADGFAIHVKFGFGNGKRITLNVETNDAIDTVKALIQNKEGIKRNQQRLHFGSFSDLDNGCSLSDYGIEADSTLDLVPRGLIFKFILVLTCCLISMCV